jgi:transcriptional regulator with XRE-family HTH domain
MRVFVCRAFVVSPRRSRRWTPRQSSRNLRAQRVRAGLSQEALGDLCNLHRTEVGLLERAGRDPRLATIVKLARALNIPAADLLDGLR